MLRLFFAMILFCIGLSAASYDEFIKGFDDSFASADKHGKQSLFTELKSIYVKAIINSDDELKKESLVRLIPSAKSLGIEAKSYEKDLAALNAKKPQNTKAKSIKVAPKEPHIIAAKASKPLYLMSAVKKPDGLELKFNQNIDEIKTRTLFLNTPPVYRNVLDIPAILNGKSLTYQRFLVDKIRIAQFDKSYVRIVLEDSAQKTITAEINGDKMLIKAKDFINKEASKVAEKPAKNQATKTKVIKQTNTKNQSKEPVVSPPAKAALIVIDPGHGGSDPGAVGGKNMYEKTAVLAVAKKLGARLKKLGYRVKFTRDKDVFINLRARTKFANDNEADIFISIHANAAPNAQKAPKMKGIETFFLSPARSERSKNAAALENKSDIEEMNFFSQQTFLNFLNREKIIASNKLGIDIQKELIKRASTKASVSDGGVREGPFWVLVGALMPAVLVEIGYITHPIEGKLLFDSSYQDELAKGIANGVVEYFKKNR